MKNLSNENVIQIEKNGVKYLRFKKLLEYEDIIKHAYSLGVDTNYRTAKPDKQKLPKDEYEKAIGDYKKLCNAINVDYTNIIKTNQEHTNNVAIVNSKINIGKPDINLKQYNNTDALLTNKPNLVLSTTNADCILLLFFDPITKTIANTHSGWRGTLQRISVKTIETMEREFNCKTENIICCICPSIRKCHFEVDKDVKDMFEYEFKDLKSEELCDIIQEKILNEKWNIDTVLINKIMLQKLGLKQENIIDSGICSVCNSDMIHSYRVEKKGYGLNTAIIEMSH